VTPRAGFSVPNGTSLAGTTATNGVQNPRAVAAQSGSDPAAYAALYPAEFATPGRFNNSLVRIPALMNIEQQDLEQERLGLTAAFQWKPNENTNIGLDMVYSKFDQKSDVNQIQSVGLNRNNTNTAFNSSAAPTAANAGTRRGAYATCNSVTALPYREAVDCGGSEGVAAAYSRIQPGECRSRYQLQHKSEQSRHLRLLQQSGFTGLRHFSRRMFFRDRIVGRPGVDVLAANVSAHGNADYLELRNCRLALGHGLLLLHDRVQASVDFVAAEHRRPAEDGCPVRRSESDNDNKGMLVEFNRMDSPETSSTTSAITARCRSSTTGSISPMRTTGRW
jgi:hypothetical protein